MKNNKTFTSGYGSIIEIDNRVEYRVGGLVGGQRLRIMRADDKGAGTVGLPTWIIKA